MVLQNCKSVTLNATEEEDGVEEDEEEEDAPLRLLLPSSIVVVVVVVVVVGGVDREEVKFSDSDLDIIGRRVGVFHQNWISWALHTIIV